MADVNSESQRNTEETPLGFHSLREEARTELPVEGTLPEWLDGALIRNGPGAFGLDDAEVDHWFDGLAMLYRFGFGGDSNTITYRNRFLRTDAYTRALTGQPEGGFATGESTLRERIVGALIRDPYDNTNVITERIGDSYLAFTETPRWVEFDPDTLSTERHVQYEKSGPSGQIACAHMKRDPATGTLINLETEFGRPSQYHVYELLAPTERRSIASVPVERPSYLHSFALTPNYVVITEFPFDVNPLSFFKPGRQGPFIDNFQWRPDEGTRFLVIDRDSGDVVAEPVSAPCFGFHHVNAFERTVEGATELVLDLETVPNPDGIGSLALSELRSGELGEQAGTLTRFSITDPRGQTSIDRIELFDGGTSLPTVSAAQWLDQHRYVYAQGTDQPMTEWPRRVLKIDVEDGSHQEFTRPGTQFGEPLFIPRSDEESVDGNSATDDGVVLTVGLNHDDARSRLYVLDGQTMREQAVATLPHAVPFDFHGRYFPELA